MDRDVIVAFARNAAHVVELENGPNGVRAFSTSSGYVLNVDLMAAHRQGMDGLEGTRESAFQFRCRSSALIADPFSEPAVRS